MIKAEQIQDEAVEAAAKEGVRESYRQAGATEAEIEALLARRMANTVEWSLSLAQARAACAAMLAAWSDGDTITKFRAHKKTGEYIIPITCLRLPLEVPNDKA